LVLRGLFSGSFPILVLFAFVEHDGQKGRLVMKISLLIIMLMLFSSAGCQQKPVVSKFRLAGPDRQFTIDQASGLCFGEIGDRRGLWLVCDRNGGASAGRLFYFSFNRLHDSVAGQVIQADEAFEIVLPENWPGFVRMFEAAGRERLAELRRQIRSTQQRGDQPRLDLEAVTIGPAVNSPDEQHIFVAAEQPDSLILELSLEDMNGQTGARMVGVYLYAEPPSDKGSGSNDGIEGLAQAGRPGELYWAEEGTRSHSSERKPRLMFTCPRLGRGTLDKGKLEVEASVSKRLTALIWKRQTGDMQTLNALARLENGHLLAVDRNGGWILHIDPERGTVWKWLNLYNFRGRNLRDILADFPENRRMPYVSIEGLARDRRGYLWIVDDPAMPEAFRESCLIRIGPFEHFPSN
jgi:hypothetical protein